MKKKTEHTPTPWTFNGYKIVDAKGNSVETKENRKFVVHAVNSYEAMLDALKHAARYLELEQENGTIAHVILKAIKTAEGKGI